MVGAVAELHRGRPASERPGLTGPCKGGAAAVLGHSVTGARVGLWLGVRQLVGQRFGRDSCMGVAGLAWAGWWPAPQLAGAWA